MFINNQYLKNTLWWPLLVFGSSLSVDLAASLLVDLAEAELLEVEVWLEDVELLDLFLFLYFLECSFYILFIILS